VKNVKSKYVDRKTGYSILTENDLDMLHEATLDFMEDYGVSVYGEEAHEYFEGAGCEVDRESSRIRFPRNLVNDCIESTPGPGTLNARDPNRSVKLGHDYVSFTNFGVGTMLLDPYTGERSETTLEDLKNITRFLDAVDEVDQISPAVTATDMPTEIKELYEAEAIFNNTSKHFAHDTEGGENTRTFIKMAAVVAGGMDKLRERPIVSLSCCPNSPLEIHEPASEQIIEAAKAGIPFEVLSMGLSGGTTPVTLAGTLLSTNCEILAGIVLGQIVCKGLSMTYGSSTTIMDMRMATSPVGAPEHAMIGAAVGQIGRYYDIPTEAGGT
jgi:trimethylamine--corrinoid protein Co-methyltransferase